MQRGTELECPECGKRFVVKNARQKFCSSQCQIKDGQRRKRKYYAEDRDAEKRRMEQRRIEAELEQMKKAPSRSLAEVCAAAKAAGMTYGQYLAAEAGKVERLQADLKMIK